MQLIFYPGTDADPTNICYNTPGNYSVSLIAANTVTSDTLTLNNYITVYPYPSPQGILQSGDTLIANQGAVSYQWYHGGNIIPGATDYFYIATESGNFNVVATDVNGCEVEAAIFDVVAGIQAVVSDSMQLNIYPNPVREKLYVNNYTLNGAAADISIYNLLGEKIYSAVVPIAIGSGLSRNFEMDCRLLSSGMYYLELSSSEKTFRTKFIKQ